MCLLRDAEGLSIADVILGVSTDSAYSHRAFSDQHRIDFPLLSDSDASVAREYGVRVDERHDHCAVARSALFVAGPDQQVQYAWQSDSPEDIPELTEVKKATDCHGDRCDLPDGKSYLF